MEFGQYFTRAMFDVSWFRQKEDPWHGLALARLSVYIICLAVVSLACVHHCPCLGESRDHRREPTWSTTSLHSLGRLVQCYGRKPCLRARRRAFCPAFLTSGPSSCNRGRTLGVLGTPGAAVSLGRSSLPRQPGAAVAAWPLRRHEATWPLLLISGKSHGRMTSILGPKKTHWSLEVPMISTEHLRAMQQSLQPVRHLGYLRAMLHLLSRTMLQLLSRTMLPLLSPKMPMHPLICRLGSRMLTKQSL